MKIPLILVGVAVGTIILVYALWKLISRGEKRQMAFLKSRPLVRDGRALDQGLVQIEGRAEVERPLRSPLAGQPALAWLLHVGRVEDVDAESPSGNLVTVRRPGCLAPFHVNLGGTHVHVAGDPHWIVPTTTLAGTQIARMTGRPDEFPEHIRALLISCISQGIPFVPLDERLIVDEFIIPADATVFVVGEARKTGTDPEAPRRAATSWHIDERKKVAVTQYRLPPRFPLFIEEAENPESPRDRGPWTIGPGANRPLLVVEGTKEKLLDDMAHFRKSLHVDFPVD